MIDIHSHVLPQVDDGSESWDETENIFRIMASNGYTRMVATPHWAVGMPAISQEIVETAQWLAESNGLSLSIARECRLHPYLSEHVRSNPQCRVDGGNVVLVELPWGEIPHYTIAAFGSLIRAGYQPVLAHAERHSGLFGTDTLLPTLIDLGVPIQVNLASISGKHGRNSQERSIKLLEQGNVSILASDIHSDTEIHEAVSLPLKLVKDLVGSDVFEILTQLNPRAVLDSRPLANLPAYSLNPTVAKRLLKPNTFLGRLETWLSGGR